MRDASQGVECRTNDTVVGVRLIDGSQECLDDTLVTVHGHRGEGANSTHLRFSLCVVVQASIAVARLL